LIIVPPSPNCFSKLHTIVPSGIFWMLITFPSDISAFKPNWIFEPTFVPITAGTYATVFSHGVDGVTIKLASGKFTTFNPKNRAMIGTLSGGGVTDRPFMRAGVKWRRFRSKGQKYPIVRGVAQAAYVHPHGGGRHQHVGQSSTVSRNAPPGAKVGSIAARKTGRARIKERK